MKRTILASSLCLIVAGAGGYSVRQVLANADHQASVPRDLVSYRDVVKRVLPAVVSIEAKTKVRTTGMGGPARGHDAMGSGFVVDPSGIILTNDHVVRSASEVTVLLQDGRRFTARKVTEDPKSDLAVVRVDTKEKLPFLKLGDSDGMEVGDRVLAIGAPLGLTGTVTSGIISAKGRDVQLNAYDDFLQTDAAINPGNSGGPLVNLAGEVIGINSAIRSETGGFQGIGLAISSKLAKGVLDQLVKDGAVHRGYLGVHVQGLDPEVAARLGLPGQSGVLISQVMAGSPAAKAGLKDGDVLVEVAGQPVHDPRSLQKTVAGLPIGKTLAMTVVRDGDRKSLSATLEEQTAAVLAAAEGQDAEPAKLEALGMEIADLTPERAEEFGYHAQKDGGVVITQVEPDSLAYGAGLRRGALILKVDQQGVRTAEQARQGLAKGSLEKGILLQVRNPRGETTYVLLKKPSAG